MFLTFAEFNKYTHTTIDEVQFEGIKNTSVLCDYIDESHLFILMQSYPMTVRTSQLAKLSTPTLSSILSITHNMFLVEVDEWPTDWYVSAIAVSHKIKNNISFDDILLIPNIDEKFHRSGYSLVCKLFDIPIIENFDLSFMNGGSELVHYIAYIHALQQGDPALCRMREDSLLTYIRKHNTWWNIGFILSDKEINRLSTQLTEAEQYAVWCSLACFPEYRQCDIHELDHPNIVMLTMMLENHPILMAYDDTQTPEEVMTILKAVMPPINAVECPLRW